MRCQIICVGTEILLGDIVNTNAVYLSKQLAELGIDVLRQSVVGDNDARLEEEIKNALCKNDIVILTGGLGPTNDDITKEISSKVMDEELVFNEKEYLKIEKYFSDKKIKMAQNNKKQAYLPKNCTVLQNDNGTAPGFAIEKDGKCIICLPGPPREMRRMFETGARMVLEKYSSCVLISHNVRMTGIGESSMAQEARNLLESQNPTVAPYAKDGECLLRVTAKAESREKAEELCAETMAKIQEKFKKNIYGIDVPAIEYSIVEKLKEKKLKVAFAESCTGGLCAKRLTDVPGASEVIDCAIVSYSNEIKRNILGVKKDNLDNYGAVSKVVSIEMAQGVAKISGADIGIGITGIAGPESDSNNKPVGLCMIAASYKGKNICREINTARNDRDYNRIVFSTTAFDIIRNAIDEF